MKRYSEYKDSGVKWIGEIPGHWKITTLKRHCKVNTGGTPSMSESRFYESPTIPWFTPGDLSENLKLSDSTRKLSKTVIKEGVCKLFPINTVYFVGIGATVGKVGYSEHSAYCNQQINALIPYDINYKYLTYYLVFCKPEIVRIASASTLPIINQSKTGNIPLIELSIPEQEAIVTYLDTKVAKIDEYISIAEKKIAALEELKQTIIAEAVTRGIHKDVPMKDSGVKWIGMIPEHWDLKRAQNIVESRKAGAWGEDSRNDERDRVCLRIADFDYSICRFKRTGDYTIRNYKQEQISSLYLNKGDILIEKSGGGEKTPVGRAILYDLDFYQPLYANFMEKITLREFASSSFYVYLLRTFYAKGCVWKYIKQTTGLQNLDLRTMLGSETFPVPPLSEQQEIVTYIEAKVANINQLCQAERSQIEKLKEYKQRLISDVVTGKVKVTND